MNNLKLKLLERAYASPGFTVGGLADSISRGPRTPVARPFGGDPLEAGRVAEQEAGVRYRGAEPVQAAVHGLPDGVRHEPADGDPGASGGAGAVQGLVQGFGGRGGCFGPVPRAALVLRREAGAGMSECLCKALGGRFRFPASAR